MSKMIKQKEEQMRAIKFRAWDKDDKKWIEDIDKLAGKKNV